MTPPHPDASGMVDRFLAAATKSPLRPRIVRLSAIKASDQGPGAIAYDDPFHVKGFRKNHLHSWSIRFVQPEIAAVLADSLSRNS